MADHIQVRFFFLDIASAVEALLTVLEDARDTKHDYTFGSMSAKQVMASGLMIVGDAEEVASKVETIDGAQRHNE